MLFPKRVVPIKKKSLTSLHDEADNITESRLTQAGLRTSEIRYRRLFEAARDGILILDAETLRITDVNPFMTELLGYSRSEFQGKELWQIGLFNDKEASQRAFRELQAKGYLRYEDLPLQSTNGKVREVEFVSNVYEEDGQQVIQCNIRDITERKHAEEERRLLLESAEAARAEADIANTVKDEFLATISHELRTPLTSILGWAKLLADGNLDEPGSKRAVETIVRNARAQGQLIDDLLDISRIITGKLRLDLRPVEIAPMIEAVIDSVRPAAGARNIHLHTEFDPIISPVSADPDRVQQIIWNLLSNAIKFTPEGGSVAVRLARVKTYIEIAISDTGQGIDPELLLHVFDRFRQADSSITRKHGGLGVGLSIVRQLVEMHGGTVTVESPGPGQGTVFRVRLPVMVAHDKINDLDKTEPMIEAETSTDHESWLNELRVLVVDDEPDTRELIAAVLSGSGALVVSVASAVEALTKMEQQTFDLLVSDIGMPGMDGYALISKIRQLPEGRGGKIPAAAITAYAGIEDRKRVLSSGYQMHIAKPVEPVELTKAIASLAGR